MVRHAWVSGVALAFLIVMALTSTSLTTGAAAMQVNSTEQRQTVDAIVQQRFQATATAQTSLGMTQTMDAALNEGLTQTAGFDQTVNAAFATAVAATAISNLNATGTAKFVPDNLIDYGALPQSRAQDGGFVLGNPNAPVTLVLFGDFACPHCQEYYPTIQQFLADYVVTGKAKFEYRIFPTAGGQLSYFTGQLLECGEAQKSGSFWKGYGLMYDYAFTGRYNQDVGRLYAHDLDLNYGHLLTCASSATQVQTDINFGTQSGVTGTPAVMVRYDDGAAQFITYNGRTYNQGGPPYIVLASAVEAAPTVSEPAATGAAFLATNASVPDIHTTASGLQYKILVRGSGPKPRSTDTVTVNYRGTFLDGTEFDSSYARKQPATFALNELIPGWTEGLQLMPVGSKYIFYMPPELAYGEGGSGSIIPPNTTLVFEVELLAIK